MVTIDYQTLVSGHGLARLGGGQYLRGDDARRLACDANIHRIITNGRSEVLDVGRLSRTPTVAQHRAVVFRDRHCTWPGCAAPNGTPHEPAPITTEGGGRSGSG